MALDDIDNMNGEPFRWAIIPIVLAFFAVGLLYYYVHRRRARRYGYESHLWPRDRAAGLVPHRRWGPWAGTRSQEGLNELGEAPPPYVHKGDEEEAQRPPEYPAVPPAAVTTGTRS